MRAFDKIRIVAGLDYYVVFDYLQLQMVYILEAIVYNEAAVLFVSFCQRVERMGYLSDRRVDGMPIRS